jgi:zinc transport system ATP-binding protein
VVSFENVTFAYNAVPVLEHVSLSVREGEFAAIVGPNGGGKTTLLKLALGLLRPTSGVVRLFGQAPRTARHRAGYTPQHADFDPHFPVTVMDVVLMGRVEKRRGGAYGRLDRESAEAALAEMGLVDVAGRPFDSLSGGQRQRALIARALVANPELLLLDEPTANVDAMAGNRLLETLHELSRRMTIAMVSHDLGFVSSMVQSVICVNREVVVHPTSDITGQTIQDLYGHDMRMVRHDHRCAEHGHTHD